MTVAEAVYDLPAPENTKPILKIVEALDETAEPKVIRETLLPLVEIAEVDQVESVFDRIANLDTASDTTAEILGENGIYIWPLKTGQGIHLKRSGSEEDTRLYVHWDKENNFRRIRMHRLVGNWGSNPHIQTFYSTSSNKKEVPAELLVVVNHLEEQVTAAEIIARERDRPRY